MREDRQRWIDRLQTGRNIGNCRLHLITKYWWESMKGKIYLYFATKLCKANHALVPLTLGGIWTCFACTTHIVVIVYSTQ